MRQLFALALSFAIAVPAAAQGQGEIIIRRPGTPDRIIRLDSTAARAELSKVESQLREWTQSMPARTRELTTKLQQNVEASRMKTLALKGSELATTERMMPTLLREMSIPTRRQPHLGVQVSIEPRDADKYGATIITVTPGSPAEKAGILSGDVITRIAGKSLAAKDAKEESNPGMRLISIIATLTVGKPTDVELRRGTQTVNVKVTPVEDGSSAAIARLIPGEISRIQSDMPMSGQISLRGVPAQPQYNVFTNGNAGYAYTIGSGGLFANIELTSLNEKLGSYFGTTEGVLVVNVGAPRDLVFTKAMTAPGMPSGAFMRADSARSAFGGGAAGRGGAVAGGRTFDTTFTVGRGGRGGAAGAVRADSVTMMVAPRASGGGAGGGGRGGRVDASPVYVDGVPVQRRAPFTMGVEPGDVIVSVDGRKVTSPSQLMRIVSTYEHNDEFKLQIMRQKRSETLTVKVP